MGLIDLKTNLKSLKYGSDQQGGGSSGQPFITTPIPDGYAPKSIDFLLRNGILNPANSITDAERLTKFFATTSGILFTTKQIALERQNPKLINTNRIYLPTSTILQAGVLSTGTHLNKQGLNPAQPLSYFSGGTTGYYAVTRGIGESPLSQVLPDEGIENRLTIAYTAKIANQPLGTLAINPFGISTFNSNVLLSYNGGPNADLGLGNTNIRIQNPTITFKDVYDDGDELAKERYKNPNRVSALYGQKFLSHKEPAWIYDITKQGASFQYESLPDITPDQVYDSLFTDDYRTFILNRDNSILSPPIQESNTINTNTDVLKGKPDYLVPSGVTTSNINWVYNITEKGASAQYQKDVGEVEGGRIQNSLFTDDYQVFILGRNTFFIPPPPVYEPNTINTNTDVLIGQPDYLVPSDVNTSNVNWTYNPENQGASAQYQKDIDVSFGTTTGNKIKNDLFVGDGDPPTDFLKRPNDNNTLFDNSKPSNTEEVYGKGVYAYTGKQIVDQDSTARIFSKKQNTSLDNLTDYRYVIAKKFSSNADPLPSTDYKKFNREKIYKTSQTNFKPTPSSDEINKLPVVSDPKNNASKDIIKFYFELIGNNNANSFLFFRAYLNSMSDTFSPQWDSYKYVGRAENFYKYNGFSRDISLEFTIYGHSKQEMIPLYSKLNALVGSTAPDYNNGNLMKGNFIKLTIGDYLLNVPGFIKNITLTPSFEAGWDINRDDDGLLLSGGSVIGQVPKLINVSLGFTPVHSFTPTNTSPYIRNI